MSEQAMVSADRKPYTAEPTAGMLLRRAREATGLHVAALAVAMKVPVKKLEALEADRLGELTDAVFVRALAASMCRALKIDPAPVLSKLPQSVSPKLDRDERGINMPFQSPGMHYGNSVLRFVLRPAALWVIGLLAAALVVLYFPEVQTTATNLVIAPAETSAKSDITSNPAAPQSLANPPSPNVIDAVVAPASAPTVAVPAPVKDISDAVSVAISPVTAPAQSPVASSDLLVFKAKSTAWVRVSDAKGAVQFEKTLVAGETASASGVPPLAIVVGNVSATDLLVRGQAFNLEEVAKNNVARFEVK